MGVENRDPEIPGGGVVELTRVQPIEAEVIVARLRASGIPATLGADSVYPSLTFADGVPVFVPAEDAPQAEALLKGDDESA
jgi:hypothetical protein